MSNLRKTNPVCITVGDIHLSDTAPACRAEKGDEWYGVMANYLGQLRQFQKDLNVPVVCTGDVFDDGWREKKCPPKLINFAASLLPEMFSIPGQHDLPHHRYDQLKYSGYWSLMNMGKINNLEPGEPRLIRSDLWVTGFPWGTPVSPMAPMRGEEGIIKLAVCHSYIYEDAAHAYPGVDKNKHVANYLPKLDGYDAAVFGDNHKGFHRLYHLDKTRTTQRNISIFNGGTFIRRKSDEIDYRPRLGVLDCTGKFHCYYLDLSQDRFVDFPNWAEQNEGPDEAEIEEVVRSINDLRPDALDFATAVMRAMDDKKVRDAVRQVILKAIQ